MYSLQFYRRDSEKKGFFLMQQIISLTTVYNFNSTYTEKY